MKKIFLLSLILLSALFSITNTFADVIPTVAGTPEVIVDVIPTRIADSLPQTPFMV